MRGLRGLTPEAQDRKNRFKYGFSTKAGVMAFFEWKSQISKEVAKAKYPNLFKTKED